MSNFDAINQLKTHRNDIGIDGEKNIARQRIHNLLDANSFVEIGAFVSHRSTDFNLPQKETPSDGVITGYGTIDSRLVFVYSQDAAVLGGSIGEMNAKKISRVYEQSLKMGAAVIAILDCSGARIQEGLDSFEGYGQILKYQSMASGVVPQISIVLGKSLGMNSILTNMSDFVFMDNQNSIMFLNSPNTMDGEDAKTTSFEQIGNANIHSSKTGLADFCFETENECLDGVKQLLGFLPSNNLEDSPLHGMADDLNRIDENLNSIDVYNDGFDIRTVISSVSDSSCFFEIKKEYAKNIVTGFARFNGYTAAVIANQPSECKGLLDVKACKKLVKFMNFCDSFNIPVITFTDAYGYVSDLNEEFNGISKSVAEVIHSFINATVPKINIIVGEAFGSAYIAMNSKHIGADIVYAWPSSQISVMKAEAAVDIMYVDELKMSNRQELISEYEKNQTSPYIAAKRGYVDNIIEPAETRKYLISAIEMLESKRENRPAKKHSSLSL